MLCRSPFVDDDSSGSDEEEAPLPAPPAQRPQQGRTGDAPGGNRAGRQGELASLKTAASVSSNPFLQRNRSSDGGEPLQREPSGRVPPASKSPEPVGASGEAHPFPSFPSALVAWTAIGQHCRMLHRSSQEGHRISWTQSLRLSHRCIEALLTFTSCLIKCRSCPSISSKPVGASGEAEFLPSFPAAGHIHCAGFTCALKCALDVASSPIKCYEYHHPARVPSPLELQVSRISPPVFPSISWTQSHPSSHLYISLGLRLC